MVGAATEHSANIWLALDIGIEEVAPLSTKLPNPVQNIDASPH
jgi:hypothetical protein